MQIFKHSWFVSVIQHIKLKKLDDVHQKAIGSGFSAARFHCR